MDHDMGTISRKLEKGSSDPRLGFPFFYGDVEYESDPRFSTKFVNYIRKQNRTRVLLVAIFAISSVCAKSLVCHAVDNVKVGTKFATQNLNLEVVKEINDVVVNLGSLEPILGDVTTSSINCLDLKNLETNVSSLNHFSLGLEKTIQESPVVGIVIPRIIRSAAVIDTVSTGGVLNPWLIIIPNMVFNLPFLNSVNSTGRKSSLKDRLVTIRGGDVSWNGLLLTLIILLFALLELITGFQIIPKLTNSAIKAARTGARLSTPTIDPHQGPGTDQCLSYPPSRFERETLHTMKQMCAASADQNGFVMDYDEAYNLIKETYPGFLQITEDCKMTDWQTAKKSYHFQKGFGIDLDQYPNFHKEDLVSLQNTPGGLIPYVQKGGKLPPIEFIKDSQQKVYDFCHLDNTEINRNGTHYGINKEETPCIMFFNRETRQIAAFNKTSGDLITAEKFRQNYFEKCIDSGQLGKPTNDKPTN